MFLKWLISISPKSKQRNPTCRHRSVHDTFTFFETHVQWMVLSLNQKKTFLCLIGSKASHPKPPQIKQSRNLNFSLPDSRSYPNAIYSTWQCYLQKLPHLLVYLSLKSPFFCQPLLGFNRGMCFHDISFSCSANEWNIKTEILFLLDSELSIFQ